MLYRFEVLDAPWCHSEWLVPFVIVPLRESIYIQDLRYSTCESNMPSHQSTFFENREKCPKREVKIFRSSVSEIKLKIIFKEKKWSVLTKYYTEIKNKGKTLFFLHMRKSVNNEKESTMVISQWYLHPILNKFSQVIDLPDLPPPPP